MAKNVNEPDFISGDRSMSFGRKTLVDGSIAETRRNMGKKDTSQESKFFMKEARKILWRELRGTPLKTGKSALILRSVAHAGLILILFILVLLEGGCFEYMSAHGANHRKQILNCPLKHVDLNNNLPFLYNKMVHSHFEVRFKLHINW
jgi:hypothetical protein